MLRLVDGYAFIGKTLFKLLVFFIVIYLGVMLYLQCLGWFMVIYLWVMLYLQSLVKFRLIS